MLHLSIVYDNQIIEMYLILDNKENQLYSEDEVVVELDFSTPFLSTFQNMILSW